MKRIITLLIVCIFCTGCSTSKKASTTDNSRTDTVSETRRTSRPGDTVTLFVPNVKYKDTTITRTNYATNTVLTTKYDSQGNQTIDCISGKIEELIQTMKQTQQNDIKTEDERESSFNPQYILYAIAGLALVVFLGLGVLGFLFLRLQKQLPGMTADIVNKIAK